jgi:hypothetical protein
MLFGLYWLRQKSNKFEQIVQCEVAHQGCPYGVTLHHSIVGFEEIWEILHEVLPYYDWLRQESYKSNQIFQILLTDALSHTHCKI